MNPTLSMSITFQINATTTRLTTYGMKKRLRRTAKTVALAGSRHTLSQICIKLKHFDRRTLNAE
jgi:hypothetical protein